MHLIEVERRGRILAKGNFGCLKDVYTLNITRGCEFNCVYCYARGYPEAPSPGDVFLYRYLPQKLAAELDNPRRRASIDRLAFNTASDSFQTHPDILDTTFQAMTVLLERGIGFSFLTKGAIPDRFLSLFAAHADLVTAGIGLVSMQPRYRDLFEPFAATVAQRLKNIESLQRIGIRVQVCIDPIIPFFTDEAASIRELYAGLSALGVRTVALSYLHLRPAILQQLGQELPATAYRMILTCFHAQPWSTVGSSSRSKLIPRRLRSKGYRRFVDLAAEFGIEPYICACKNPDMPGRHCSADVGVPKTIQAKKNQGRQLSLF
jgi:DNA repair photolyase